jgi:DNA invertase Pin-like site-specific DNA recombinase
MLLPEGRGHRHHHGAGKLVSGIFAALAESERDLIRSRL